MPNVSAGCIVIGIGNPDRGDDAAGRAVARRLRGMLPPAIRIDEHDGEATGLLARLEGAKSAYLIDACLSSAPAGTVQRFDVGDAPLPQDTFAMSTHGLGLAEAIELGRALGQLPACCVVYAIEVGSTAPGDPLSAAVTAAIDAVAERVCAEVSGTDAGGVPAHA